MTENDKQLDTRLSWWILVANTVAFAVCFAAWMINGVLVTFLLENGLFSWSRTQAGLLIGIPVLTGAVMRLPVGVLCDFFGGRIIFTLIMLVSAVPMFLLSFASSYFEFALAGLGFGLAGASFAAGVAYSSVWFSKQRIGTALGIFGVGNAGAAATALLAPVMLTYLTSDNLENWRRLPLFYAGLLVVTGVAYWFATRSRKVEAGGPSGLRQRLQPLTHLRVWRFGLYYGFFFGGYVALAQWLIPYYVNVYTMTIGMAGFLTMLFSLPASVVRAAGGWMSDRWGARAVMYGTLTFSILLSVFLFPAAMVLHTPGKGIVATESAVIEQVESTRIRLADGTEYKLLEKKPGQLLDFTHDGHLILPSTTQWQEPVVEPGQSVKKGQLLARGTTRVFFQANQWVFTVLVLLLGCAMGIGMAAVYKHIPAYFPTQVGVVGGIVGVMGGLGGFVLPIVFGALLEWTGLWTTCWMLLALIAAICLIWMHGVIRGMMNRQVPDLMRRFEVSEK